jgi:hypothetical protein
MGDVVRMCDTGHGLSVAPLASRGAVGIGDREIEAALKIAPAYPLRVQQIANVFSGHKFRGLARVSDVAGRLRSPISVLERYPQTDRSGRSHWSGRR